jgi:hypothetical protein
MRKLFAISFVAAATCFAGSITIDNFDDDQGPITNNSATNGTVVTSSSAAVTVSGATRVLEIMALTSTPPRDRSAYVCGAVDCAGSDTILDIQNGPGDDSEVRVIYTIPAINLPVGATNVEFFLTIVQSDGNPTDVVVSGVASGSGNIPGNTMNLVIPFPTTGTSFGPGTLTLTFNGADGWDLSADSFGIRWTDPQGQIPEPGSMLLIGLGAAGLGLLRRRAA